MTRTYRALRKRISGLLDEIGVPRPWDVAAFCDRVARHRGRPLHLMPVELPPDAPDGAWLSGDGWDAIVYDSRISALRAEHIICHELAHILLGHKGTDVLDLTPDLHPTTLTRMGVLARAGYSDAREREAELAAAVIWELAARVPSRAALPLADAAEVDRFATLLAADDQLR